ncbi:DUF983 domain-containing protein [Deminuibacter soli]|uniref:DUF983 domain-containing protein n=1 Tax=Deminuibacter soli TaxID=2291815 RepID=A0A3E1NJV2_9BACT|nr:DUF983 domain-containing protein [Deminuibacter soli]RFM28216.1 DUF983 domain-containing protein [Deminuibacter soli]
MIPQQEADNHKPSLVLSALQCKCPRCRRGHMFKDSNPYHLKHTMSMYEHCQVCGQQFDIEVGFYYGTSYVSYAFTVAFSAATFVAWWVLLGFSLNDNRIFYWLAVNAVLLIAMQPIFMRIARSVWLAFFVYYDPQWNSKPPEAPERVNDTLKDAW